MELRDYQDRIVTKTIEHHAANVPSVCITSPTGSGKSVIGLKVAEHLVSLGLSVGWVAMRRNLLRQVAKMNQLWNKTDMHFISMFDSNPEKVDVIILDECQHAATESFNHIANHDVKFMLGLSATPLRTDKLKLPFQKTISDAGIHRLIQEGWLSPYQHYCLEEFTPRSVAEAYLKDQATWGKSVVFFHKVAQCEEFQQLLAFGGVKCEVVHGATSNAVREDQLDRFENGEYPVIANVAILTEGFDCPDLQTVFCRDSAKLPTIQMAGRGFRIHDGKTHCNIVQSKLTKWQFTKTARPQLSWVQKQGSWFALGSNKKVNVICKNMLHKLVDIDVEMPSFILKNRAKKRIFQRG